MNGASMASYRAAAELPDWDDPGGDHDFCEHGVCIRCGVKAAVSKIDCDPPIFTAACKECLEEKLGDLP